MPYKDPEEDKAAHKRAIARRPDHYRKLAAARMNAHYHRIKALVFERYGNACQCCGEANPIFFAIDHVNGGGNKLRKAAGHRSGLQFFKAVLATATPEDFQILCHNCNWAKYRLGRCPHQDVV